MSEPTNFDLLVGVARLLADETLRVPLWVNDDDPSSIQPAGTTAVHFEIQPPDIDVVTLADYTVSDDVSLSDTVVGVQVRIACRDIRKRKDIEADIFDVLHGRRGGMLGGVKLVTARRESGTNVGQDSSNRLGRIENYYLTIHRPSSHRQ